MHVFPQLFFLTATFHEQLALLYGDVPEPLIGFLNKVYTGALGAGANDMQTPVTTTLLLLLLLLSGAVRGKPLGPFVRSIDTNPWPDDKRLNRVIKKTLAKAKDKNEVKGGRGGRPRPSHRVELGGEHRWSARGR